METTQQVQRPTWRKSSHSGSSGGDCVEVADLPTLVAVRDSKNPGHGILTLSPEAFAVFVGRVASGNVTAHSFE